MSLPALRLRLAQVTEATPPSPGLRTGIAELDAALPDGVPRGRVTALTGAPGAGRTAVVRQLVAAALAQQADVAYIDGARTLTARDWAHLAVHDGFHVVRPPVPSRAAWCADLLLRSGAFGLVVLDGGPRLERSIAARLAGLAREKDAALVLLAGEEHGGTVMSALRLAVRRERRRWRRVVAITVQKGGERVQVELPHDVPLPVHLGVHAEPPDRRAAAWHEPGMAGATGTGSGTSKGRVRGRFKK